MLSASILSRMPLLLAVVVWPSLCCCSVCGAQPSAAARTCCPTDAPDSTGDGQPDQPCHSCASLAAAPHLSGPATIAAADTTFGHLTSFPAPGHDRPRPLHFVSRIGKCPPDVFGGDSLRSLACLLTT